MKPSNSSRYALLAAGYIAQHAEDGIILSNTIADNYGIPLEYLLKLMQDLVKINVLRSKRGPNGGFCLARPLNKIAMLEVIEAVEGPMNISIALQEHAPRDKFAAKATKAYDRIIDQARSSLRKIKLSDLV